jgi:hypothetical protein
VAFIPEAAKNRTNIKLVPRKSGQFRTPISRGHLDFNPLFLTLCRIDVFIMLDVFYFSELNKENMSTSREGDII